MQSALHAGVTRLQIHAAFGVSLAVPLLGMAGLPADPLALLFLVVLGLVSTQRPVEGLALVLLINGFSTLVRASNPGSMVLAGFTTLSSVAVLLGAFVWLALRPRNALLPTAADREGRAALFLLCGVVCFIGATLVACVRGATGPLRLALLLREQMVPAALFFVALLGVRRTDQLQKLILMFGIGAAVVAAANLLHYAVGIGGLDASRVILHRGSSEPALRQFFIFQGVRLYHILGLSTQGGGAVYYGLAAIGLYYGSKAPGEPRRRIWWIPIIVLIAVGIFTFSNSWLVLMAVFLGVEAYRRVGRDVFVRVIFLPLLIGALVLIVAIPGVTGGRSVLGYGVEAFIQPGIEVMQNQGVVELLTGEGLTLISGGMVGQQDDDVVSTFGAHVGRDRWLLVVQLQMGLIGFGLAMAVMLGALFTYQASDRIPEPATRWMVRTALLLILLSLTFAHGFAFIERLFSPVMYSLAGGVVGICLGGRYRNQPTPLVVDRWPAAT